MRSLAWARGAALAGILLLGAAVRLAAAFHEPWLDEVWSILFGSRLDSPLEVFFLHNDSNHYLNTLYVGWLGRDAPFAAYRIPALCAGVALPVALALWARDRAERLFLAILSAGSFLLAAYSVEARGYAPMLLFGFLAFAQLERTLAAPTAGRALLFAAWAVLALLWQLTFAHLYCALLLWSAAALIRSRGAAGAVAPLLFCHAAPLIALALLYAVDVRSLEIAGGPARELGPELARLAARIAGLPEALQQGPAAQLAALGLAGAVLFAIARLARDDPDRALFFAGVLFLGPALWWLVFRPPFLHHRYFLVCVPFLLMLLARDLAAGWRGGARARAAAGLCAALYALGNGALLAELVVQGHGSYRAALRYAAAHSAGPRVTLASDQDFRNARLLEFYLPRIATAKSFEYRLRDVAERDPPEWLLVTPPSGGEALAGLAFGGRRYRRADDASLCGSHWTLYRWTD